jgi:phage terminase large subunit
MEGITRVWVAEADKVPHDSWDKLVPTIRTEGSKFYIDFNTDTEDDPVYKQFVLADRDDTYVIFQTFEDNPFFPDVLRREMEYDRKYNHERYLWIWEGKPRSFSESCVFSGKYEIDDFETPEDAHFMHGADWGFAHDPAVLVRCFEQDGYLYIDREAYAVGVEIDDHPKLFDTVPTASRWPIIADSARPEIISYMRKRGYRITPAKKGRGSIIAGIDRLKNFKKLIVHPRCRHTIEELKLYSYKRNTTTGDVMPILVDEHNHVIDALRYATEKYKKNQAKYEHINLERLGL